MIHITTGEEANRGCIQGRRIPVLYSKAGPGCPRGGGRGPSHSQWHGYSPGMKLQIRFLL